MLVGKLPLNVPEWKGKFQIITAIIIVAISILAPRSKQRAQQHL